MSATALKPAPQSNARYTSIEDYLKAAAKLGAAEAQGALSRPEWAIETAIAAAEGVLDTTHAEQAWNAFRKRQHDKLSGQVRDVEKAAKIRISETRQIIFAGMMPGVDFAGVLTQARAYVANPLSEVKGNTWDCFVALARTQKTVEGRSLSPAEVEKALAPNEAKQKDEAAQLKSALKSLEGIRDGKEPSDTNPNGKPAFPSDELDEAISLIEQRLAVLAMHAAQAKVLALSTGSVTP